jgi:hypothetical protein
VDFGIDIGRLKYRKYRSQYKNGNYYKKVEEIKQKNCTNLHKNSKWYKAK